MSAVRRPSGSYGDAPEAEGVKAYKAAVPNSEGRILQETEVECLLRPTALSEASRRKSATSEEELDHSRPREKPAHEEIKLRAYHIFLDRGGIHGHDLEDWVRAQRELDGGTAARRREG
jgi:hypothetical protein